MLVKLNCERTMLILKPSCNHHHDGDKDNHAITRRVDDVDDDADADADDADDDDDDDGDGDDDDDDDGW